MDYSDVSESAEIERNEDSGNEDSGSDDVEIRTEKSIFGYRHFLTEIARERYVVNWDSRSLWLMKEYNLDHPLLTDLRDKLYGLNWDRLLVPPRHINRTIVAEFYACVYDACKQKEKFDEEPWSVQVRGKEVEFGAGQIADLLEIPHDRHDTDCLIGDDLSSLQGVISDPDTPVVWARRTGARKDKSVKIGLLSTQMVVLNKIIHTNLLPSVRSHEIGVDQIDVLYRMASGIPVSVGGLLHSSILKCAMNAKNNVVLPQLITTLCSRAGVPVEENDVLPRLPVASVTWSWTDPVAESRKASVRAEGRARVSQARRAPSESDQETDQEFAPTGAHVDQSDMGGGDEGTSRSVTWENSRFGRFVNAIKEHISEALSGVCSRVDVIEAESKERDAAQAKRINFSG